MAMVASASVLSGRLAGGLGVEGAAALPLSWAGDEAAPWEEGNADRGREVCGATAAVAAEFDAYNYFVACF